MSPIQVGRRGGGVGVELSARILHFVTCLLYVAVWQALKGFPPPLEVGVSSFSLFDSALAYWPLAYKRKILIR